MHTDSLYGQRADVRHVVMLLTLVSIMLYIPRLNSFQVGAYMDDANYIVLAQSIASGRGFSQINLVTSPPETRYPPGFPLILAPFVRLFPNTFLPLKLLSLLFTSLSIPLLFLLLRRWLSQANLIAVLALSLLNPLMVAASSMVMSESSFLFFVLLTLALWKQDQKLSYKQLLLAGLAASMAFFIRTVGIVLLLALVGRLVYERKWKKLLVFAALIVLICAPWFYRNYSLTGHFLSGEYESQFLIVDVDNPQNRAANTGDILNRLLDNLWAYTEVIPHTCLPMLGPQFDDIFERLQVPFIPTFVRLGLLAIIVLGFMSVVRTEVHPWSPWKLFVVLYVGVIWSWPWRGWRFLHPIVPFLYVFLLIGASTVMRMVARIWQSAQRLEAVLLLALVLVALFAELRLYTRGLSDASIKYHRDLTAGAAWIEEHSTSDSIVMADHSMSVYLYANRRMVELPSDCTFESIADYISSQKVDFVLLAPRLESTDKLAWDNYTRSCMKPAINELQARHEAALVYANSLQKTFVYEILH